MYDMKSQVQPEYRPMFYHLTIFACIGKAKQRSNKSAVKSTLVKEH